MSIIINFFGGPCSYKSTIAAELFSKMKWAKIHCELVHEFAKQKIYEENAKALELQFQIGFNQLYNQKIVADKVDVVVTDSPFILSNIYNTASPHLNAGFVQEFNKFRNINYLLVRNNENYTENGRIHNYEEAVDLDNKIRIFLDKNRIPFKKIVANKNTSEEIMRDLKMALTNLDNNDNI